MPGLRSWRSFCLPAMPKPEPGSAQDPILEAMRFGTPDWRGIIFAAQVEPTAKSTKATDEQMAQLQQYESYRAERVGSALLNLWRQKREPHKTKTVLGPLPKPEPIYLQPYAIDYSIAADQLGLNEAGDSRHEANLQIGVLAYDADGEKVAGIGETIKLTIPQSRLESFVVSRYRRQETMLVPERATVLRLAVRDLNSGRIGSVEVLLSTITSPYPHERKRLELPPETK